MLKKVVLLSLIAIPLLVLVLIISYLLQVFFSSLDKEIDTSAHIKQLVLKELPSNYQLKSITAVQRYSEFEDEHRLMKWIILTLNGTTMTDEKYKIAEPICKALLKENSDFEGMDINGNTVDCSQWGP